MSKRCWECRGDGEVNDLEDDGSGKTCYCDCEAGQALRERDRAALAEPRP